MTHLFSSDEIDEDFKDRISRSCQSTAVWQPLGMERTFVSTALDEDAVWVRLAGDLDYHGRRDFDAHDK